MKRKMICLALAVGMTSTVAMAKRDPDVNKAIKAQYPDAQTQVLNVTNVNGVKVSNVKVTTKEGEATAQVTEDGDFLNYGLPRSSEGAYMNVIRQNTEGLFKNPPQDVQVFRATNYVVDLPGSNGQAYQATFDAVGRLRDLSNSRQIERELAEEKASAATGSDADAAQKFAKQYFPDIQVEGVYKSNAGPNVYNVKTTTGNVAVSSTGQLFSVREMIPNNEMPKPVSDAVSSMFKADKINKVYRTEWEYYQFNESLPGGEQAVIRMRTNGDVLKVITPSADQETAELASHKQKPGKSGASSGSDASGAGQSGTLKKNKNKSK
ncbi:MAG TPA: hypothetical protein VF669_00015 [Tepidisphaeraceae bacterium]|jgi:hypothetical protein